MHKTAFLVAAACAFGLAPFAARLGVVGGAAMLMVLAVALASAASGGASALAVASGALGAFTSGILMGTSGAVAGACLVGLAFAERTLRVRGKTAKLAHVGVAVLGGGLAGTLSTAYASAPPVVRCVSVIVAAVLVALPLLVDADDPIAHALDTAAGELPQAAPARAALHQGAELRRNAQEVPLDPETARGVRQTWRSFLRLAEARVRLERGNRRSVAPRVETGEAVSPADAVRKMVDQRIADHVTALARAYTAVDTAHAAELGLDDAALRSVDAAGETLEDVSRAIVEVKG
jgi:hypothetical protein